MKRGKQIIMGNDSSHDDPLRGTEPDEGQIAVADEEQQEKKPPQYAVILHNDDYTTMEFVVEVLQRIFKKTVEQSMQVMLSVHKKGKGVAGIYSYEIAETKVVQTMDLAKRNGFPLKASFEPIETE